MAELLKLLQANGAFKYDLMEALISQGGVVSPTSSSTMTTATTAFDANLNVSNPSPRSVSPTTGNINEPGRVDTTTASTDTASYNINTGAGSNVGGTDTSAAPTDTDTLNMNVGGPAQIEIDMDNFKRESDSPFFVNPNTNSLSDVQGVLAEAKVSPTQARLLLIDQVTDVSTEAHMSTTLNTQGNIREANERISRQAAPPQIPDMSKMSMKSGAMWQHFLNSMLPEMTKVVRFSKQLPGFSELDMDDQIRLLKQGIFEVMIARITLLIDHVNDTMIDPSLKIKSPRTVVRQMPPLGPFIDQFFEIAKQTNPLSLTDGENGLFGAILILCPDRHGLKNASAVQTIQKLYLQSLYKLMKYNHKDADETFCALLSSIPTIRKANDDHFRFLSNIKRKSATKFDAHFPQLHREVFDTTF